MSHLPRGGTIDFWVYAADKSYLPSLATQPVNPAMGFVASLGLSEGWLQNHSMCDRSRLSDVPQAVGTASGSHPLLGFFGNRLLEMRLRQPGSV